MKAKIYVGCVDGQGREIFRSETEPTLESHGDKYLAVIGPFRTMRGARFLVEHGRGNPHIQQVSDAERIAKYYADGGKP
jgi:hypothetical protein